MRLLLVVGIALTAALLGMGPADASQPPVRSLTWKAAASPFRLTILEHGDVLVQQQVGKAGAGTRFSYRKQDDGAMETLTSLIATKRTPSGSVYTVATTEPARTAKVTVARTSRGLRISLDLGSNGAPVRTVYEAFRAAPNEHFLGAGEQRDHVDLRGAIVPLKVWADCGTEKPAPFYLSSAGYGVNVATSAVGRIAFGRVVDANGCQLGTTPCEIASGTRVVQMCFKTSALSYEIFAGSPEGIVRAYTASVGRPPLPDPKAFALVKWRDSLGSAAELDEDIDRFQAARIPLGWVIIDNPWEAALCAGSLEFDPTLFPDPKGTIDHLHARGISVMMWVSPSVRAPCGLGLYPADQILGTDTYRAIDLTEPTVLEAFEQRLRNLLAAGVDGFKADRGDEVDLEQRPLAGGNGTDIHNRYPLLYAQAVQRASVQAVGKSVPMMFRGGFTGSQHVVTGTWSGDLNGSWDGLENAIRSAQTAGIVGYSTWGSDIGGYTSRGLPADVFVRWSQLGAVSPIFEVGGDGLNATPWVLGDGAMAGLRKSATLHYELFPYHYQLAREASSTGLSIVRPLALQYPKDERSWASDYELLIGSDLLAAPLTAPGTTAHVYLPPGDWLDLATGAARHGPVSFNRPTPLDELPLYLRSGAAIPYNLRSPDVWRSAWQPNDLFRAGRGGWLIAPSSSGATGSSADYGSVRVVTEEGRLRVVLDHAQRETQVVVLGKQVPKRVTIDGRTISPSGSVGALRLKREGWLMTRGAHDGVVLKLRPAGGHSVVALSF